MTPKEPTGGRATGTSFKGAFMYYTHDKRGEGEDMRLTSDRVAWAEYRNLATDDPHLASSIMAATAANQSELKKAAGVPLPKKGESDQVVYHYSLGWHPDEAKGLTKPEMLRAANESIRALSAEHCQAAIIAHNDTAHPHVHVILNRVNPETGEMLNLWQSQKRLSKWAMAYEQERGKVLCESRVENWNKRAAGETVHADKARAYHHHDQAKKLGHANDNDTAKTKAEQSRKDSDLSAYGEKQRHRHKSEWEALSKNYQDGKAAISRRHRQTNAAGRTAYQQAAHDVREQFKPLRSALGRKQWGELMDFEKRERRLSGKLENALAAVRHARTLDPDSSRGFMSMSFNFLTSSKARKATLEKLHRSEWQNLNAAQKAEIGAATQKVKADQQAAYKAHRRSFNSDRQSLIDKQDAEKADLRRKWQNRKIERSRAFKIAAQAQTLKKEAKAHQRANTDEAKRDFQQADQPKKQRRTRKRSRSRKISDED